MSDAPLTFLSVATEWDSAHGGLSTFNRELCCALARGGHRVYCGIPRVRPEVRARAALSNVQLVAPTAIPGSVGANALNRPFEGLETPVDVVIGHGRITGSAALAQVRDRLTSAKYVHFLHMDPKSIEWDKAGDEDSDAAATAEERVDLEVQLGHGACVIVAVGPELAASFSTYFHPYQRSVHEFLPGLFASEWNDEPPSGVSCLIFGRAEDEKLKGVGLAAQAMGLVCADEGPLRMARLVVRGAPRGKGEELQNRLQELGGDKVRVVVEPFTPDATVVRNSIRGASLVLMPSREEGFGLSGLEAISEGIPVLLSRTSGLAQAIQRCLPELAPSHIVDVQNGAEHLAARIRQKLSERDMAFDGARGLRSAMRNHFDWDAAARALVEAIQRCGGPLSTPGSEVPPAPGATPTSVAVAAAFQKASSPLLSWRQTLHVTNAWLDRPEQMQLLEYARAPAEAPMVLLGAPGSGKSALLARVAHQLVEEGFAVLGIKADRLPRDVDSQDKLALELGLPSDLSKALAATAELRRTVLIVDQLDALGDLVDLRTERLSVLLELVNSVAGVANIPVLMSCRTFDYHHDLRFRRLAASELHLAPADWTSVSATLRAQGMDSEAVSLTLREVLCTPQALDVFLETRAAEPGSAVVDTYQRMLEVLWEQRLGSRDDSIHLNKTAERIAMLMAEREELWLARALLATQGHLSPAEHLLHAGILVEDHARIAFTHQTFFEFARARAFLAGNESLVDYVLARQGALFIRPTLWTSLAYLRSTDWKTYLSSIEQLWRSEDVRRHVHMLLIQFLGQLDSPAEREAALLIERLHQDAWRAVVAEAIAGRPAWFGLLSRLHLPALLRGKDAGLLVDVIVRALDFAPDDAIALLETEWHTEPSKHELLANVLCFSNQWPQRLGAIALDIVSKGTVSLWMVERIIRTAMNAEPALAPLLVAAELNRQLVAADSAYAAANADTNADAEEVDELAAVFAKRDALAPYRDLIDSSGHLHCIRDVAAAEPRAFVEAVWPWFVRLVERIALPEDALLIYARDYALGTSLEFVEHDLISALDESLRAIIDADAAFALSFVDQWKAEKTLAVHRLLIRALDAALPHSSDASLAYLLEDKRRFVVGDSGAYEDCSAQLIAHLAPELVAEDIRRLEEAAMGSRCVEESAISVDGRRVAHDANRRHRIRLLQAIGKERLSALVRANLDQEERRFPEADEPIYSMQGGVIGSPVSTEQMLRAKDEDLLRLFEELHDGTGFDHPSRNLEGGSVQASRAFAEAVKRQPERFAPVLFRFRPGLSENPVAAGVEALAEVLALPDLEALVLQLVRAGFFVREQQSTIAYAVEKAAHTKGEVSDEICQLFESWLVDDAHDQGVIRDESSERFDSLLFGPRGGDVLPGGNYPTLRVLTTAYLERQKPRFDEWVAMLERHLERTETPKVWRAMARSLEAVLAIEPARAETFLDGVFSRYPAVRDSRDGLAIIAHAMHRLPLETVERWMTELEAGSWARRSQAYGELLALLATRKNATEASRDRLERELTVYASAPVVSGVVLGVAHSAARLWSVPERRRAATDILIRIVPCAQGPIAEAVMYAFQPDDSVAWDDATRALLQALLAAPTVLPAEKGMWFAERLQQLLPAGAELVADIALALARAAPAPTDYLLRHGSELVDLATTLQRLGSPVREKGLDLFEVLLEHQAYGARALLAEIDPQGEPRKPMLVVRSKPRPRRRPRRK
jgi:glycosyltransferase involved in cell wall biosynthesis